MAVHQRENHTGRSGTDVSLAVDPGSRIDMPVRGEAHPLWVRLLYRPVQHQYLFLPAVDPFLSLSFFDLS